MKTITLTEEQAQQIEEVLSGMLHGTDWNNGTHAKIYRPKFPEALATIRAARAQEQAELNLEQSDAVRKMIDISEEHERQRKYAGKYESGYTQSLAEQQAEMEQDAERNVVGLAEQAEQEPVVMDESWCLEPQPVNGLLSKEQAEQEPMYISKYCVKSGCACHYSTAVDGEPVAVYTTPQPVSQEPVAETIKNNIFKAWGVK